LIAVIDYGVANLGSMCNMLRRIGAECAIASTPEAIRAADKLVLPGIGAFDHGMEALAERRLIEPLRAQVLEHETPILAVCLGAQLLGDASAEGQRAGLGMLRVRSERFVVDSAGGIRVPHMGWNVIKPTRSERILRDLERDARFYFVHSYHMVCADPAIVLATAMHGIEFTAIFHWKNIYGAQFHPEKSHKFGMRLLQNFVEL
jgi:imidazole glycerol-phosphate synthase subunit HisH